MGKSLVTAVAGSLQAERHSTAQKQSQCTDHSFVSQSVSQSINQSIRVALTAELLQGLQ